MTRPASPAVRAAVVLTAALAFVAAPVGEERAAPQTFRSTSTTVQVDAIVLDRNGNFVPDLNEGDLVVFEDGKPQKITQFYMVTHDRALANAIPATRAPQEEDRASRIFVVVFDEWHLANDSLLRVKKGAEQFVNEHIGPGDIAGVYVNEGMFRGRLTNSKTELLAGIQASKPAFDNRQALLSKFREWPRIPSELEASRIADGARQLADALSAEACKEDPIACQISGGVGQVENQIEKKARDYIRQARVMADTTIRNLQYVINRLARVPGRKTVVLLTEGFFVVDNRSMITAVAAQAARAGTTIYSIDGRGLISGTAGTPDVVQTGMARSTVFDTGGEGPAILTANTGGFRIRDIDDIGRAFNMIVRDTSSYYVIGYQPDNATFDGKYRKIEVKTGRANVTVRARKGYLATPAPPMEPIRGGGTP